MASITTRKNGSRFIGFIDAGGKPRTVHLGKVPMRYAESMKVKVEDLVCSSITGHAPSDETSRWLAGQNDRMIAKLARVSLTQDRHHTTLEAWLSQYLKEREGDLKSASLRKLEQTRDKLLAHFDPQIPLHKITGQLAAEWRQHLRDLKLSEAAIKTHCGNVKTIMAKAVRRNLIDADPFLDLKSGATPSRYSRYVSPDEIGRIIEACPTAEWKLLFSLARYGGLRIPSESQLLTWADVDWGRARLLVRSPKTEHHDGHDERTIPITPYLMRPLQDRFDECPDGEKYLVTLRLSGAARRRIKRICQLGKVEPWARLWQTLRQSCEKQWAMRFPQYAVSKWIGHSITVSGRHYANAVPDELFDKAAELAAEEVKEQAQQNAQQKLHERTGNEPKSDKGESVGCAVTSGNDNDFRESSTPFVSKTKGERGDSNPRPPGENTGKQAFLMETQRPLHRTGHPITICSGSSRPGRSFPIRSRRH